MIDFSNCQLQNIAVHRVGNKHRAEKNFLSNALLPTNETIDEMLQQFLLKPFKKQQDWYRFQHSADLQLNEIYTYTKTIFETPDQLLEQSGHILQHLYNQSEHPNIKSGELYVVLFQDILLDDELVDGLGIFKSEQKHHFFKVRETDGSLILDPESGIHLERLDKGCLILNTASEDGFRLLSIDQNNYDAQYWPANFLQVDYVEDQNFHTRMYMELCNDFSQNIIGAQADTPEQVQFRAASVDYFKTHETFDVQEFTDTVLPNEEAADQFRHMQTDYGLENVEQFNIAPAVVNSNKRKFRNQIKLDTNIKIQLDVNDPDTARHHLVKGFDEEKGMFFYKVYFNEEL